MRHLMAFAVPALIGASVSAAPAPHSSWGKAGVSLDQYRNDALQCGLKGHYSDISQTQDVKELVRASRQLDNLQSTFAPGAAGGSGTVLSGGDEAQQLGQFAATQQHIIEGVRVDQRYRNIKQTLEEATAQCLQQRGYSRFALTDEQRRQLSKLKPGSEERRAYLYNLASSAAVLHSQMVTSPR